MSTLLPDLPAALKKNPFFQFSEETNFMPAWDKIKPEHVMPAFEYAFAQAQKNVEAIRNNKTPPTFDNTSGALETSNELIFYFLRTLFSLMPEDDDVAKSFEDLQKKIGLRFFNLFGETFRDEDLYKRLKKVDASKISQERQKVHVSFLNGFKESGMKLSPRKKKELKKLERRLMLLEMKSSNVIKKAKDKTILVIDDETQLEGLSELSLQTAAEKAKKTGHPGKWVFTTNFDSCDPFLKSVKNRALREKIFKLRSSVGTQKPYDNRKNILELARIRYRIARLLGYEFASTKTLDYHIAENPETVNAFLCGVKAAATPSAETERDILAALAKLQDGVDPLEAWDLPYYEERLREQTLGFREDDLRPYFELETVLKGVFKHLSKHRNLRFEESKDYPVPNKDIRTYNVYDTKTKKFMGVLCLDLFERKGKHAATAWNCSLLPQGRFMGKVRRPVDVVAAKFPKGTHGRPTLLLHSQLETLVHEMGHATHNLCSKCEFSSMAGTAVKIDFVEFMSQFEENYAFEPEFLDMVAVHHKTGERLPQELKDKIKQSRKFMAGMHTMSQLKKGWLDLAWHTVNPEKIKNVRAFEKQALAHFTAFPSKGEFISPSFSHIFGGGYQSAVYSYIYGQVWEADAFEAFKRKGLYDRKLCAAYRKILEAGDTEHPKLLYQNFRHRAASHKAFMKRNGFAGNAFNYAAGLAAAMSAPALAAAHAAQKEPAYTPVAA